MGKVKYSILLFLCVISVFSQQKKEYPIALQLFYNNVKEDFLNSSVPLSQAEKIINTLNINGSWPGIDYSSKQRGRWPVIDHLQNIQFLSKIYLKANSKYYQNPVVLSKINLALDYWLQNDFICPNWWYPQIGVPEKLAPILIVMEEYLSPKQIKEGVKILDRAKIGMGGQNKVWLSGNVLLKSLLVRKADSVAIAAKAIQGELKVSTGLGIQPDFSFHEHGVMLQQGNYGLSYLTDMIQWVTLLRKTPYAFDESKLSILRSLALEGSQWFLWKNTFDIGGSGRQLFKGELVKKKNGLITSFRNLKKLDTAYAQAYTQAQHYKTLTGNKHFWNSDFHVCRTTNYLFTLKMSSSRVSGYETVNSENMLGYHLGSGMTLLYQSDREYLDIFPFWDWKKLPGTTIIQDTDPIPVSNAWGYKIEGNFVGGLTNGTNGVAVLQYNRGGLTANKSWFMIDDQIVCLGSGITAQTPFNVTTAINQQHLKGDVLIDTKDERIKGNRKQEFTNPNWVLHDHLGYLFPTGGNLSLITKKVVGSWHSVAQRYKDEKIKAPIFNLYLNHGENPNDANYEYILVPNASKEKLTEYHENPKFKIVNTKDYQSVSRIDDSLTGIVFYLPTKVPVFGGIAVDSPCVLMAEKLKETLKFYITDPTHTLKKIKIAINGKYKGENCLFEDNKTFVDVNLPEGDLAGKTITYLLKK